MSSPAVEEHQRRQIPCYIYQGHFHSCNNSIIVAARNRHATDDDCYRLPGIQHVICRRSKNMIGCCYCWHGQPARCPKQERCQRHSLTIFSSPVHWMPSENLEFGVVWCSGSQLFAGVASSSGKCDLTAVRTRARDVHTQLILELDIYVCRPPGSAPRDLQGRMLNIQHLAQSIRTVYLFWKSKFICQTREQHQMNAC